MRPALRILGVFFTLLTLGFVLLSFYYGMPQQWNAQGKGAVCIISFILSFIWTVFEVVTYEKPTMVKYGREENSNSYSSHTSYTGYTGHSGPQETGDWWKENAKDVTGPGPKKF